MRDPGAAGGSAGWGNPLGWTAVRTLIVLNLGVFILQHFVFRSGAPFWHPDGSPGGGVSREALSGGQVWTLVTYMFVHSGFKAGGLGFLHILGNVLVLFFLGRPLEARIGRLWTYVVFFGGGLAGALFELLVTPQTYLIGASGGTMAILLGCTSLNPGRRIMILIPLPVELQMRTLGRLVIGLSVVFGVIGKLSDAQVPMVTNVAHFAHLGGALFGMLVVRRIAGGGSFEQELSRGDILRGVGGEPPSGRKAGGKSWWPWGGGRKRAKTEIPNREKGLDEREYDEVLDKVSAKGIHSLTAEERRILQEASERINRHGRKRDG